MMDGDLRIFETNTDDGTFELVKEQGKNMKSWVSHVLHEIHFGCAQINPKGALHGFALCCREVTHENEPNTAVMDLVCEQPCSRRLIECVETEARARGFAIIKLMCLPNKRMRSYYEDLGYIKRNDIPDYKEGVVKLYQMSKQLI